MTFIQRSPLNYQINDADSIRRFAKDRAPTSADFKNFKISDLWLDTSSTDWWKQTCKYNLWIKINFFDYNNRNSRLKILRRQYEKTMFARTQNIK